MSSAIIELPTWRA